MIKDGTSLRKKREEEGEEESEKTLLVLIASTGQIESGLLSTWLRTLLRISLLARRIPLNIATQKISKRKRHVFLFDRWLSMSCVLAAVMHFDYLASN